MTTAVFLQALGLVLDPYVLMVILCSAMFGLFVGCIPGLTATMATALLVPWRSSRATFPGLCCAFRVHLLQRPTPTSLTA